MNYVPSPVRGNPGFATDTYFSSRRIQELGNRRSHDAKKRKKRYVHSKYLSEVPLPQRWHQHATGWQKCFRNVDKNLIRSLREPPYRGERRTHRDEISPREVKHRHPSSALEHLRRRSSGCKGRPPLRCRIVQKPFNDNFTVRRIVSLPRRPDDMASFRCRQLESRFPLPPETMQCNALQHLCSASLFLSPLLRAGRTSAREQR